jgi:glutaredoxin
MLQSQRRRSLLLLPDAIGYDRPKAKKGKDKMERVKVYGADWCGDTQRTLRFLNEQNVSYDYINIEEDERAADWVKQQNDGKERKPTVKLGARVLSVPSDAELESALREEGVM